MAYKEMVAPLFGVDTDHERERVEVEGLPTVKLPGAVGAVATWTVVVAVEVPFAFVAVRVYMTVEVGFTVIEPTRVEVEKEPGVITTELAFETFQVRVEVPRDATIVGEAVKEEMPGWTPEDVVPLVLVLCADTLFTPSYAATA